MPADAIPTFLASLSRWAFRQRLRLEDDHTLKGFYDDSFRHGDHARHRAAAAEIARRDPRSRRALPRPEAMTSR